MSIVNLTQLIPIALRKQFAANKDKHHGQKSPKSPKFRANCCMRNALEYDRIPPFVNLTTNHL